MSFAVLPIWLFLGSLLVAPQLWWSPLLGLRVDYIVYPMWLIVLASRGRLGEIFRFRTQDHFFLLMYVWIFLSVMVAGLTDIGQFYLVYYAKLFLVYRLVSATISDVTDLKRTGYALIALALLIAIEGIQHMNSPDGIGWAGQSYAWIDGSASSIGLKSRIRWIGIFDGPGVFCVLFTIVLPFVLVQLGKGYGARTRAYAAVVMALILVATYFIGSRGGMVATLAIVGIYFLVKSKLSFRAMVACGALGGAVLMFAPSHLTTVRDSQNSTQYRVEMWAEGLEMMKQNPLLGIGRGNFKAYTAKLIAHNSAVEIGGETGLVGLYLYIGLIYFSLKSCLHARKHFTEPHDKDFALAAALGLVGYIVSMMFVTLEYETFYLLLAMCAALGRCVPEPFVPTKRDFKIVGVTVFLFLVFVQVFVIVYLG